MTLITGAILPSMPVASVARAMLHDAWVHFKSSEKEEASSNCVIYDNAGINRLCQVNQYQ